MEYLRDPNFLIAVLTLYTVCSFLGIIFIRIWRSNFIKDIRYGIEDTWYEWKHRKDKVSGKSASDEEQYPSPNKRV